jgi:hypothetical protein
MLGAVHFGAAILASFGVACASTVDVQIDQRKDFAGYCTWNFLSLGSGNVRGPISDTRQFDAKLGRLVERGLLGRGFARATDRPDFYVTYALAVRRQLVIVSETPAMEYLPSLHHTGSWEIQATERRAETYETGHLRIFVSDPHDQRVVWRGKFEGRFRDAISNHLEGAVSSLLERLPAPAAASGAAPVEAAPVACPASRGREIREGSASGARPPPPA